MGTQQSQGQMDIALPGCDPPPAANKSGRDSKSFCLISSPISIFLRRFCPLSSTYRVSKPAGAPARILGDASRMEADPHTTHQPTEKHRPHSLSQKSSCENTADLPADGTGRPLPTATRVPTAPQHLNTQEGEKHLPVDTSHTRNSRRRVHAHTCVCMCVHVVRFSACKNHAKPPYFSSSGATRCTNACN